MKRDHYMVCPECLRQRYVRTPEENKRQKPLPEAVRCVCEGWRELTYPTKR